MVFCSTFHRISLVQPFHYMSYHISHHISHYTSMCTYIYIHIYTHIQAYIHCVHMCTYIHVYIYIYVLFIYIYIHVCMYIYIYVCVCVCICVCIHSLPPLLAKSIDFKSPGIGVEDPETLVLRPAVEGTLNVLRSCAPDAPVMAGDPP